MTTKHLRQDIRLPIKGGDPIILESIASVPEAKTVEQGLCRVADASRNLLFEVVGSVDPNPSDPQDGKRDWTIIYTLTGAQTAIIGRTKKLFSAKTVSNGQQLTFAAGTVSCVQAKFEEPA